MKYTYDFMNEDQKALVDLVHEILAATLDSRIPELEEKGEFPWDVYNELGKAGFWAMDVPEEYGGLGLDAVTTCLVREALGYHDAGFACAFSASTFGIKPVLLFGSEEQKQYYGAKLAEGVISAQMLTEPQSGSDVFNMRTTAVKEGDEYVINGRKAFVTNGGLAGIYTVAAVTAPADPANGKKRPDISLFIVDRDTPGVSVGKEENKMGIRISNTTDVVFDNVRVPAANLIGEEAQGMRYVSTVLARTRPTGMAPALGLGQRALDLAVEYARTRETKGAPIGMLQAIQFKLADMQMNLMVSRSQLMYNAQVIDAGTYSTPMGSVTKAFVSGAVMSVCDQALQIYGGYGYSREYPVEKLYRDARIFSIFEGTNEIQRQIVGRDVVGKLKKKAK